MSPPPSAERAVILNQIFNERLRQDTKWGFPQHRSTAEWITILAEEFGEAAMEANEVHFRNHRHAELETELVQVAAVCVSILEHLRLERAGEELL